MALLPLAGWAADIEVRVYGGETHFTYGAITVPTTNAQKAAMFVYIPSDLSEDAKAAVAGKLQYTSELTATSNAGTYDYTFSLISAGDRVVSGLGDGNTYTITVQDPAGSFVVGKADPVVNTVITADPAFATEALSYTGQPQSLLKSDELGTAAAGFTLEYSVDNGAHWAANGYMVTNANPDPGYTVKYRTAENINYNASTAKTMTGTKVVAKGTPSITTVPTLVAGFTYDGLEKAIIATAGVAKIGDITLTSGISYQLQKMGATDFENVGSASTNPTTLKIKNIGEYRIQYSIPTTDPNLSPVAAVATASITVAPAPLTYSIDAKEKVYGTDDPALTVTYSGFVNEETATAVVTTAPALSRATGNDAGSYDITVTNAASVAATNYVVTAPAATAGAGKFTITPKPLNNTDFTFTLGAEPTVYTGSPITKTVATAKFGTTNMTYATDYSYVCTNNVNAGTANVIISGQGNFKGTVIVPFTITAAPIYIKPADASKIYGADDPDPLTTYTLVDGDGNPVDVTLNGTPTITRVAGENVGVYTISVTGYTAGAVADNYAPTAFATYTANFTINAAGSGLVLKFKEGTTATKVYDGTKNIDALAYSLNDLEVVSGLVNDETWEAVKPTLSTPVFTLTSKDVDTENNQVTVTGLASTNYPSVTVQPLAFTVTPSPIEVTVSDQTITYGSNLADPVKYDATGWNWKVTDGTLYGTDDLELTLKTENALSSYAVSTTAYENAITAESANTNYDLTVVNGNLTVNAGTSVAFKTTDDMQPVISAYDTKSINVSFAADQFKMNIGEWYAMVLPFDIDPLTMVTKFNRYVIFNELNKAQTDDQNIKFTLTLDPIDAGTPFLIKFAPKDGDTDATKVDWNAVAFGAQTIKDGITDVTTDYVTFTATYTTKNLHYGDAGADVSDKVWWLAHNGMPKAAGGTYTDNNWKKPKTNAHDALPFEAYLTGNSGWTTYAPNITVEDFDGSVTAIKSLSADEIHGLNVKGMYNLNGMKMNNVPTQKGIYIINGKKVVIK